VTATKSAVESDDAVVAVVSLYAKQKKIYPRAVSGWFAGWRWALVWFTQLLFYGLPWLDWSARQAVLFDLGARRFYIFGLVLYPQDFIYLTGLLIICAYALFLFTAVAGRLWCGNANRLGRAAAKQMVWIGIGLWTGVTFVGYFTPIRELVPAMAGFALGPWETFWVLFYGFATYGNAGYMREQVCKYMCPYARFQSAMFDKDTLLVAYDAQRGDPRGTRSRKLDARAQGLGDCIDCGLCVQVCPTGIDIREGLQYECIGCTACIDVCNGVMDKMKYPRGLIRYTSQNGLASGAGWPELVKRSLRPRVLIYTLVLGVICTAFVTSLWLRPPVRLDVERDRATLARLVDDGYIENVYRLQLMNATESPQTVSLQADGGSGLPGLVLDAPANVVLEPAAARWLAVAVRVPPEAAQDAGPGAHELRFTISIPGAAGDAPRLLSEKSTFIVPR
jgi:cytochrome c oxidase accessory protein FixG